MAKPSFKIGQGEALNLRVSISLNNVPLLLENVEKVEFAFGDFCKCRVAKYYPRDVLYDSENDKFIVPLTQNDTFAFHPDSIVLCTIRVKFIGNNNVRKAKKPIIIQVLKGQSREVL